MNSELYLPTGCLIEILRNINNSKDWFNVSLLCKEWNNVSKQEILYKSKRKQFLKLIKGTYSFNRIEYSILPNGKREGLYRSWHYNGIIYQEYNCVNGKLEGLFRSWYENGILSEECIYINDKKEGFYRSWYDNEILSLEYNNINDKQEGLLHSWHKNGILNQ